MNKEDYSNRLLQDFSVVAANVLPIVQLFFAKLPDAVTQIFLAPRYFTGVSIVTLILSYVLILGYQLSPYPTITIPFQGKKKVKYNDYITKLNDLANARSFVADEQPSQAKLKALQTYIETDPIKPPLQINSQNLVSICVSIVVICGVSFIILGQLPNKLGFAIAQSVVYVALITFSVLVLTLYRRVYANNKNYDSDELNKTWRAIELATKANSFILLPQVKYISSFDDNNVYPATHHVRVEYSGKQFEIIADSKGKKLFGVYKLDTTKK